MPTIKSSAELRNDYNGISNFCHTYNEPIFITKNGKGDLAVMSIEAYEQLTARFEVYDSLKEGIDDVKSDFPESRELVDDPVLNAWGVRFVTVNNYIAFFPRRNY